MRRPGRVAVAVAVLMGATSCSDDGPGPGEARLEVDGTAIVQRADGGEDVVTGGTDVRSGDRVSLREGSGRLELGDRSVLELRSGLGDVADSVVLMGRRPVLEAGDLLVSAPRTTTVEADGTRVDVRAGTARLGRDFGMSVSAYDATVDLDSAGVARTISALRRMTVPDLGRPPQRPRPVRYDEADSWDLRFLGAAHALGVRLQRMADGLTGSLAEGEGRTPGFFASVLPGLDDEPTFDASLLAPRLDEAPGDTLVGAAITELGDRGDFRGRWDEVFAFHDDGAEWGIVALDQGVSSEPLIGQVRFALDSSFQDVAFGPVSPPDGPGPPTTAAPDPPAEGPGAGGSPGSNPPTTEPPPVPVTSPVPPPTTPTTPELEPALEPATGLVEDVVDGLLGGLLG